ncbi:hypothetical protein [Nonomuraea sp. NPDC050310]|uniref:hypothetical protein n=1 Tax=Nonomuraea sp. NPDC050310 TaxID=3154935 RepID=UPI0033E85FBB
MRGDLRDIPQTFRRWLTLVPLALVALTACSALPPPPSIGSLEQRGASVLAFPADPRERDAWVSRDGGATWRTISAKPAREVQSSSCAGTACYRVRPGRMAVEESLDGTTWRTVWEVSPGRRAFLARSLDLPSADELVSSSVLALKRPSGQPVVIVANGVDGLAVRDENGVWRRHGFHSRTTLGAEHALPLGDSGANIGGETAAALLAGVLAFLYGLLAAARTRDARRTLIVLAASATFSAGLAGFAVIGSNPYFLLGLIGCVAFASLTLAGCVVAYSAGLGKRPTGRIVATAVAVAVAVLAPFRLWSGGWPDSYGTALWAAVALAVTVGSLGLATVRRQAKQLERAKSPAPELGTGLY